MPSNLAQRIITALVGGGALFSLLAYGGNWGASILALVISLGSVFEFSTMAFELSDRSLKRAFLLLLSLIVVLFHALLPDVGFRLLVPVFILTFFSFLVLARHHHGADLRIHVRELGLAVLASVYLIFIPIFLPMIRMLSEGLTWLVLFFIIVWVTDTAAYFVGRAFGRHKIYAHISPKKSIEGGLGGMVGSALCAVAYGHYYLPELPVGSLAAIALLVSMVSQVGDFCESLLKRGFDKKDAGTLLPGHGGFLDRFDGVLTGLPVMYVCVVVIHYGF